MNWAEWVMIVLVLWTVLGVVGTGIAWLRHERTRVRRGALSLLVVWVVYLGALFAVSRAQPVRLLSPGTVRCFDDMCFSVAGADELEGFRARGKEPQRLLRVNVRISNHGRAHAEAESAIRAVLVDAQGRRWTELPGLSGISLTARVPPGGSARSSPVFLLPPDAAPLGLILSHGLSPSRLVIGDSESFAHRPEILLLGPVAATGAAARLRDLRPLADPPGGRR